MFTRATVYEKVPMTEAVTVIWEEGSFIFVHMRMLLYECISVNSCLLVGNRKQPEA
jgi:hypothetical protein